MRLGFKSEKVIGNPEGGVWTQAHIFNPETDEIKESRGSFFAVINLSSNSNLNQLDLINTGREVLAKLQSEYYGELSGSSFQALVDCVTRTADLFTTLNEKIEIIGGVMIGDVLNLAAVNNAFAMIKREGMLVDLLTASSGNTRSVSGKIKEGDVLVLGTSEFKNKFEKEFISETFSQNDFENTADIIRTEMELLEKTGSVGAMLLYIETAHKKFVSEIKREESARLPVREKLAGAIDKILTKLPDKKIRVGIEPMDARRKVYKTAPLAGVGLLIILGLSIFFGVRQRAEKNLRNSYESKLLEAKHQYEEAVTLSAINKARSRELVLSAQTQINDLQRSGIKDPEVDALANDIAGRMGEIAGLYKSEPNLFLDLSLISSGFSGDYVTRSGERILVLDSSGRTLAGIGITNKKTEIVSGPEYITDAKSATGYEERSFVLSSDGIREVTNDTELIIKPDWDVNSVLIAAFAGNVYVLEKSGKIIWRYPGVHLGFSEKQNWLAPGIEPDFNNARDWAIDGMIWILYSDNSISKYSRGSPQRFALSFPDNKLVEIIDIYTADTENNLYLLDRANKRVMVFSKEGEYKSEYLVDNLGNASAIVVSEEDKKLIYLSEGKLYEIEITQ